MKAAWMFTAIVAITFQFVTVAQTVGRKPPKISLSQYNKDKDDGTLNLEVDVRMADCISFIEFKNDANKKPLQVQVAEKDYFLSEENGRDILLRLSVGSLKDLLKKKESLPTELTIYSKTGKPIYTNELSINRAELINGSGNNMH
jgi:hypothetical protein